MIGKRLDYTITLILLLFSIAVLGYTGRDDSHITYFVADMIATGNGIVNYTGNHVEQSSSLLFTFVLAVVSAATSTQSAVFGPIVSLGFLVCCYFVIRHLSFRYGFPTIAATAACLTFSVIYWSLSGMEMSLYLLEAILAVYFSEKFLSDGSRSGALLAGFFGFCMVLTRPEAMFVLGSFSIGLAVIFLTNRRSLVLVATSFVAVLAGIAVRLALGLQLYPNPVYAKLHLGAIERLQGGPAYILETFKDLPFTSVLAMCATLLFAFLVWKRDWQDALVRFAICAFIMAMATAAFAVLSGGDWMENGRFFTPYFFFLILAFLILLPQNLSVGFSFVFLAASFVETVKYSRSHEGGFPIFSPAKIEISTFEPASIDYFNTVRARDISFVDKALAEIAKFPGKNPTIASGQAGTVAYYLVKNSQKQPQFLDLAGLTSPEMIPCKNAEDANVTKIDFPVLQECLGRKIDYVFHVEYGPWSFLETLKSSGCTEVLREEVKFGPSFWKARFSSRQFLARCDF